MPHNQLVALAEPSLTYDVSNLEISEHEAQALYKQQVLASMSNSDLIRIILNRPTVILKKSGINTGVEAQYVHNPLMNMYFLRDLSITTPKGAVFTATGLAAVVPTLVMAFYAKKDDDGADHQNQLE